MVVEVHVKLCKYVFFFCSFSCKHQNKMEYYNFILFTVTVRACTNQQGI